MPKGQYERTSIALKNIRAALIQRDKMGNSNPNWRGGKSSHPLYKIYYDILGRCRREAHPKFSDYGGRGIAVSQNWVDDFWVFVRDVGERPEGKTSGGRAYWQLDRIDNDGNYEPGNVRWASPSQQAKNKRPRIHLTDCRRGHTMDEANTYINPRTGGRKCRECQRLSESRRERKWENGRYTTIPKATQQEEN